MEQETLEELAFLLAIGIGNATVPHAHRSQLLLPARTFGQGWHLRLYLKHVPCAETRNTCSTATSVSPYVLKAEPREERAILIGFANETQHDPN